MKPQIQPSVEEMAWESWEKNTSDHEVTVAHEDGLYRHIRFGAPGSHMWSASVMTWPGYLATTGDIGAGFTFTRTDDMLEFFYTSPSSRRADFGAPMIDFRYWAEKVQGSNSRNLSEYSEREFLLRVKEFLEDEAEYNGITGDEADRLMTEATSHADNETSARAFLDDHDSVFGTDTWEWDFTEYDFGFILACYSIWHIAKVWNDRKTNEKE